MSCPSRRQFCAAACRTASGAAAIVLGQAVARAGGRDLEPVPTVRGEAGDGIVRVAVASTPLAADGGVARVTSTAGSFLVTRTGERAVTALSANCSHDACLITEADGRVYVCGCHGSRFDTEGQVLEGPAELPLFRFTATLDDGVLTIRLR